MHLELFVLSRMLLTFLQFHQLENAEGRSRAFSAVEVTNHLPYLEVVCK